MYTRRAVLTAKIEETYGTDPTPTAADNAMLCSKPTVRPVIEKVERDFLAPTISPLAPQFVLPTMEIAFDIEARTAGAGGVPPEIGPLLLSCGLAQTISEGTSVTYDPVSTGMDSCTIYYYLDGTVHKLTGCRGNVKFIAEVGKYGIFSFTMRGYYANPTDVALPTPTYIDTVPEICKNATISITPSGGSAYIPRVTKVELDLTNELFRRDDISKSTGVGELMIASRRPVINIDPEADIMATKNFWSEAFARTTSAFSFTYGTVGSKTVITLTAPKVAIDDIAYEEKGPLVAYTLPLLCTYDDGDDEFAIVYS